MKNNSFSSGYLRHCLLGGLIMLISFTSSLSAVTPNLVDGNASTATKSLYTWLVANYGKKVITGQTDDPATFTYIKNLTGQVPLVRGYDMQHYSPMYSYNWANGGYAFGADAGCTQAQDAINWYNNNSKKPIIQFQWHWHSPSGGQVGTNTFYTQYTSFDVSKAVVSGTQENKDALRDIDAIAVQLKKIRDAGVPIIWRPLHEAGGTWFWWSAKGSDNYKKLYNIIYDRIVNYHGIHNLIWAWTGNDAAWYPGNDKVDILGIDSYPANYDYTINKTEYDKNYNICGNTKIVAMTENGAIPDINNSLSQGAPWSYFMSWGNLVLSANNDQHLKDVYGNGNAITLGNVNYNTTCAPTPITPNIQVNGGAWVQTGTATVASGTKIILGPQPSTGGSWSWNGGGGTSGTSREQTIYPTGDCDILATYYNSCGTQSTYNFQIRMSGSGSTSGIVSGGTYSIIAQVSGKALDVTGSGTANGTNVEQWANGGNNNQKWILTDVGSGYYRVSPVHATNMGLDVSGLGTADGTNVQIWTYGGGYNEQWQIASTGSYYTFKDRNSGKYLDVSGGSTADGGNVQIWTYANGSANQQWTLNLLSSPAKVRTNLSDITSETETRIYPNPSNGNFRIENGKSSLFQIFDLNGKLLLSKILIENSENIDSKLTSGSYIAKITGKNDVITKKLVITK